MVVINNKNPAHVSDTSLAGEINTSCSIKSSKKNYFLRHFRNIPATAHGGPESNNWQLRTASSGNHRCSLALIHGRKMLAEKGVMWLSGD
jgi:hypothetical protein